MAMKLVDCLIIIILSIILIYKLFLSNFNETFEDIPTTTPQPTPIPIPTDIDNKCTADTNVIGYCLNYNGCCIQNTTINKDCFCTHPLVKNCNDKYNECKRTGDITNCKDILKQCCLEYNNINIDNNKFQKPIKQEQQSKTICTINSTNNINDKCLELCQTIPDCKAYGVDNFKCSLFSEIDPLPTQRGYKPCTDYYIKK